VNREPLQSEFAALLGAENVQPDDAQAAGSRTPSWWKNRPIAAVLPGTPEEAAKIVQAAEEADAAIVPCGGGTQLQTGYPPLQEKSWILLCTNRLNRVLDHQPDDLTVTCEPGITLEALQAALAAHRQFLPLDAPLPRRATLGGLVSTNAAGLWRPAYGTPRDMLIGLRAVMTGGESIKGGGKVVKNVAGYDVCKLFTGAWGTLGILTELSFKVRPLPETERILAWSAPDLAAAAQLGLRLHHAQLAPTFLLATNEPEGRPCLVIGLQGTGPRVEWQAQELESRIAAAGWSARPIPLSEAEVTLLRDSQARLQPEIEAAARIACLPTELPGLVAQLQTLPQIRLTAHCATGLLSFAVRRIEPSLLAASKGLTPKNATLLWTRLDSETATQEKIEVWGEKREDFLLQRALKQSLDPRNSFSPGRFLGRL
jgi:glycolate oxidase FAD binding subunit